MKQNNPFQILDIPETSSAEEIKKAFRILIRKHHPDVSGGNAGITAQIIDAYHKAIEKASKIDIKKVHDKEVLFFIKYEIYFSAEFIMPSDRKTFFIHIKQLTSNFRSILYSEKNMDFFDEYVSLLILQIQKYRDSYNEKWSDILYAVLENYKYLVIFRKDILNEELHKDEYEAERARISVIKYFNDIALSSNYMELRRSIFSLKDSLTIDCVRTINSITSKVHRQEIFSIMSLITLYSEEDFFENWAF